MNRSDADVPPPVVPAAGMTAPDGLRYAMMQDRGRPYFLAFATGPSAYESWIESLGGPDENGRLLMALLGGGGTLVDVGANIGTIAIPVAMAGSSVIAVELLPANCLRLWVGAAANALSRLHIVQAAAADHEGTTAYQGAEAWGNVHAGADSRLAVCLRLDTILACHAALRDARPLVVKIDVEGYELAVMRGAAETLRRLRPAVLFESIAVEGSGETQAVAARHFMHGQGYDLFLLHRGVLAPRGPDEAQEGHVADYLAVPRERAAQLSPPGFAVRPLTAAERLAWVDEMASVPLSAHQRHAAGILLRWAREAPDLLVPAGPTIRKLLELGLVGDQQAALRRLA